MKTRTKCRRELAATTENFHRHPTSPDGLKPRCKACRRPESRAEYVTNPEKKKEAARRWGQENADRRREFRRRWSQRHPEKLRAVKAESYRRMRQHPSRWLRQCFAGSISESLGYPGGPRWLVPYSVEDLMAHLEARWKPGMSWANYGRWHVDHIRPKCSFTFTSPTDPQFAQCWALDNIQPLWAIENVRKGRTWAS